MSPGYAWDAHGCGLILLVPGRILVHAKTRRGGARGEAAFHPKDGAGGWNGNEGLRRYLAPSRSFFFAPSRLRVNPTFLRA